MKKYSWLVILLALVMLLPACAPKQPTVVEPTVAPTEVPTPEPTVDPNLMTIRPAEFSEETQQVLEILNSNLTFFDYTVDGSIKSLNLEMWNLSDDVWTSAGRTLSNISGTEGRIGISLTGATYDLYIIDDSSNDKISYDALSGFESLPSILGSRMSESNVIVSDQEIELWMRLGAGCTNNNFSSLADFRSASCQTGLAVTVTFSTRTAEQIIADEEAAAAAAEAAALAEAEAAAAAEAAAEATAEPTEGEVAVEGEPAVEGEALVEGEVTTDETTVEEAVPAEGEAAAEAETAEEPAAEAADEASTTEETPAA